MSAEQTNRTQRERWQPEEEGKRGCKEVIEGITWKQIREMMNCKFHYTLEKIGKNQFLKLIKTIS